MDDTYGVNIYIASFFAAIVLLVIGVTVYERSAATPAASPTSTSWGGGSLINPLGNSQTTSLPPAGAPDLYQAVQSGPPFYYNPTPAASQNPPSTTQFGNTNNSFDWNAFIAELSPPTASKQVPTTNTDLSNAYAFIPQGLIGTTSAPTLTPAQQELYDYGNEAGKIVQLFEKSNANMVQILKDQFEDPQNPQKISALNALAEGLSYAGYSLKKIDPVPPQAATLNVALAASYQDMGAKLALVGTAHSDQDRAQAMGVYNQSADSFTKNYVAMVLLFSSNGVRFGATDSGAVFMFTGAGL